MNTADLIQLIAQDASARQRSIGLKLAVATLLACVAAALALVGTIGIRPDIVAALTTWRFDAKLAAVALILTGAWSASRYLARPEADGRTALAYMAAPLLFLVVAVLIELAASPAATWVPRAVGANARLCLVAILALSLAPLAILLLALRAGAPQSPSLAGAAAGLLAGSIGALFYAIHCPDDSPLFVALWYTPPVIAMTLAGALAGWRVLRW